MHLVETSVRSRGKRYRYVRLVESYRRENDGMPAHQVIANLGDLPATTTENLKVALEASRRGEHVVVAPETAQQLGATAVLANLGYLDIAVVLTLWREGPVSHVLRQVLEDKGRGQDVAALQDVLAALVIHRCVDPGSKLHAQRWYATTALPQLLGLSPAKFNNTRVHRALSALDSVRVELQQHLPQLCQMRDGPLRTMFMDVTDTWFIGHGPELAESSRTKEGLYRQRIGIVLLCNERGYPVRWEVIAGKCQDSTAMKAMVDQIAGLSWARQTPLVCDRSMGQQGGVETLLGHDLHFVTAVPKNEIDSYTDKIPHQRFADLKLGGTRKSHKVDIRMAARTAEQAGLRQISPTQYVLDLGHVFKAEVEAEARLQRQADMQLGGDEPPLAGFLRRAEQMKKELDTGEASSCAELARRYGYHVTQIRRFVRLAQLPSEIKDAVRSGRAVGVVQKDLFDLCKMHDAEQQCTRFNDLLRDIAAQSKSVQQRNAAIAQRNTANAQSVPDKEESAPIFVRAVAYFNPEMFVTQRRHANERLATIEASIADLNQRLSSVHSHRSEASILGEVSQLLKRDHLEQVFEVQLQTKEDHGRKHFCVDLKLKPNVWKKRRRYDGFVLLVAHPELCASAVQLAQLYRQKDVVEKDFETIKSVLQVRPVWHRTDPKVCAHVDICMFALLTERTLEYRLAQADCKLTAQSALATLSTCHLNEQQAVGGLIPLCTVTRCTAQQHHLLAALQMERLADDNEIADTLLTHH